MDWLFDRLGLVPMALIWGLSIQGLGWMLMPKPEEDDMGHQPKPIPKTYGTARVSQIEPFGETPQQAEYLIRSELGTVLFQPKSAFRFDTVEVEPGLDHYSSDEGLRRPSGISGVPPHQRTGGVSPPTPRIPPKPVSCPGCGAWGTHECDYCGNPLPYTYDVPKSK